MLRTRDDIGQRKKPMKHHTLAKEDESKMEIRVPDTHGHVPVKDLLLIIVETVIICILLDYVFLT
jgi:hypothetical protein